MDADQIRARDPALKQCTRLKQRYGRTGAPGRNFVDGSLIRQCEYTAVPGFPYCSKCLRGTGWAPYRPDEAAVAIAALFLLLISTGALN